MGDILDLENDLRILILALYVKVPSISYSLLHSSVNFNDKILGSCIHFRSYSSNYVSYLKP